jgi:hypothetical protein
MAIRVLVTGSRDWSDYEVIEQAILNVTKNATGPVTIVHGAARGADTIAGEIAHLHGFDVEAHGAQWNKYGKAAGPIRNQEMVDLGADVVLGFMMPGSRGTKDCISRAQTAGLPVIVYEGE